MHDCDLWPGLPLCQVGKKNVQKVSYQYYYSVARLIIVTFHDKTMHIVLTTDFELRSPLPTTTFELLPLFSSKKIYAKQGNSQSSNLMLIKVD